jgi:hypothetical protein
VASNLYPKKLALTSLTSGGRLVFFTQAMNFFLLRNKRLLSSVAVLLQLDTSSARTRTQVLACAMAEVICG